MSAIAGILHVDGRPDARSELERMMRVLGPLGPDREAIWDDGAVALGYRQMAKLPEDRFDRQPWRARNGGLVMVANVRLDNREELAGALDLDAPAARAMADSEILLLAYERWGSEGLDRIVGEFAVASWDTRERRLFCARSQIEGPPLYYCNSPSLFAFASTAGALFALPGVPRTLDERSLARALALVPAEANETFYRGISCLPPAHSLTVAGGRVTVERYWRLDVGRRLRLGSDRDYVEAARDTFDRAVAARLRSIHPVGSQLSSGCDSSAVTATAARLLAARGGELTAFTAAPREGYSAGANSATVVDESAMAAALAARFPNVRHLVIRSNGRTPFDGLDRGHMLYARPIGHPANLVWVEQILDAARERGIGVLLTGQQGNMTISYDGMTRLAALFGSGRWLTLTREAAALRRNRASARTSIVNSTLGPFMPPTVWRWWVRRRRKQDVSLAAYSALNPALAVDLGLDAAARDGTQDTAFRPLADGRVKRRAMIEMHDLGDYRNGFLAGWGIETRDPTSDRRVVEFGLAIPEDQYLRDGLTKFLYRRVFEPILPAAELAARKRGYQAADWHDRLNAARDDVAAELDRLERSAAARRTLDLPRLRRLIEDWPTGGWHDGEITQKYRLMLMRGVAAGMFIRSVEGGNE